MTAARPSFPHLPDGLAGLAELATDLAWTWNRDARELFETIDPVLWARTRHDPVALLQRADPARLRACAADPAVLDLYESVRGQLAGLHHRDGTWFVRSYGHPDVGPVAYFCAEFAVHHTIPMYSGGLGVLAGDHVKSASDLGVPMVAVGLIYRRGYFDQGFDDEGWQLNHDEAIDPASLPLARLHGPEGPGLARVAFADRTVELGAWEMRVGRVRVLLLDSDLPANDEADRRLTDRLYGTGDELRLKQEWILGTGGVRVLRALGVHPGCWHANEGHAAFMMVERVRELLAEDETLERAVARVRAASVFTTHTPVPAGHDDFSLEEIETSLGPIWEDMGISRPELMALGRAPSTGDGIFHMTAAAIRLSHAVNGVSERHGRETRHIWKDLWPDRAPDGVPIGHVTNGVHLHTWMAEGVRRFLDDELGPGWDHTPAPPELGERILTLDDARVWALHRCLKRDAARFLREQARRRWGDHWNGAKHLAAAGPLLDPNALTLGFARRFATYKRADLLLRDEERLLALLTDPHRPVQLVFSGKAHPADDGGKRILQRVHQLACDARAEGRVAFVEDYDMHIAHALYHGVDVWLNVPRVPQEASGTSGMKAALNMVPQLGTLDGWWAEGFHGDNGWAIRPASDPADPDESDWTELYRILEDEVVPTYHDRDERGVPTGWTRLMKNALRTALRTFTTDRMVREYAERYYVPALLGEIGGDEPPTG